MFGIGNAVVLAKRKHGGRSSRDAGTKAGMLWEDVPVPPNPFIFSRDGVLPRRRRSSALHFCASRSGQPYRCRTLL